RVPSHSSSASLPETDIIRRFMTPRHLTCAVRARNLLRIGISRKIVGWSMDDTMTAKLVQDALNAAFLTRKDAFGLLHHSDRGVQYTSSAYRQLLDLHGVRASMSRTGNCYDNAPVESFWGKLKTEMVYHCRFATKQEAKRAVFEYIEMFYNRKRLHAALGYVSPEQFELSQNR
ncbi:MAG: IS3 family transposase, partial [Planctomycetota bacterium]|nr:IS3 family transposase [Planctomycetota bacterium]